MSVLEELEEVKLDTIQKNPNLRFGRMFLSPEFLQDAEANLRMRHIGDEITKQEISEWKETAQRLDAIDMREARMRVKIIERDDDGCCYEE